MKQFKVPALLLFAAALAAPVFASTASTGTSCNLDIKTRPADVAAYVENGRACIQRLPNGYWWDYQAEAMFLERINVERARLGLRPLQARYALDGAARFMSLDLGVNKFWDHVGPDGRTFTDRISAFDRTALTMYASENIARRTSDHYTITQKDAEELHTAFMESQNHRRNILSEYATHVSVGVLRHRDGIWVTQVFVELSGTLSDDLPLRIATGEEVNVIPYISGWTIKKYGGQLPTGQTHDFIPSGTAHKVALGLSGNVNLIISAEQKAPKTLQADGSTREVTYSQELTGPTFSVR